MTSTLRVHVQSERVGLPRYATAGSAGLDLQADIPEPLTLQPGQRAHVPTGIAVAVEPGHVALIFARSGLAKNHGLSMVNGVGVLDSDYRGIAGALVINHGSEPYTINPGDRIAQMVVLSFAQCAVQRVASAEELGNTERGTGGYGSSGK